MSVAGPDVQRLSFGDLDGWSEDDHAKALSVYLSTCDLIRDPIWKKSCGAAESVALGQEQAFFEAHFHPVLVGAKRGLFTAYYEPELTGSLIRTDKFKYPLHRPPEGLRRGKPWHTRAEIENGNLLQGLELVWLGDPVEKFFLQVQGSGRVKLTDGTVMRVGFAAKNGHPYRSVGRELVRRGIYESHQVSAAVIRNWVRRNPIEGRKLLHHNPSYIFFRELSRIPADVGPPGAMTRPVTPGRTLAVDPAFTPLGAPVWLEKDGAEPMRRLMVAQDTGSAIKGPQRGDIFFGTGSEAGASAGRVRDPGRMIVLLPRK